MSPTPLPQFGVIEGFFGRPWTWSARKSHAEFLREYGYDFYVYAPKADPFLRRRWRESIPDDTHGHLVALSAHCRARGLAFGMGLSPLELYRSYDASARDAQAHKLDFVPGNKLGDDVLHGAAERAERFLAQPSLALLVGLPGDFAKALPRVLARHHEDRRAVAPAVREPRQRSLAVVDMRLLAGERLEHIEPLGLAGLERPHEPLDRVVPVPEPVELDQILLDALGVAPERGLSADSLTMNLAGRDADLRRRSR